MEREVIDDRQRFNNHAKTIVRNGQAQGIRGMQRLFQVISLPAFNNVIGWEVCLDSLKPDKTCWALCTQWHQITDLEKFRTPVETLKYLNRLSPTIEFHQFVVEKFFFESTLERFRSLSVPAFIKAERFGLDGTSYEVNLGDHWAGLRFNWWETPPEPWRQLGEITFEALEKLNRLLAQSE